MNMIFCYPLKDLYLAKLSSEAHSTWWEQMQTLTVKYLANPGKLHQREAGRILETRGVEDTTRISSTKSTNSVLR